MEVGGTEVAVGITVAAARWLSAVGEVKTTPLGVPLELVSAA